jgi:hypothetical protein
METALKLRRALLNAVCHPPEGRQEQSGHSVGESIPSAISEWTGFWEVASEDQQDPSERKALPVWEGQRELALRWASA